MDGLHGSQGIVIQQHEDHLNRLRRRIDELEKENTGLVDDQHLLDFVDGDDHIHLSASTPGWNIHHTGRQRIYKGSSARIAISNCILNLDPRVPNYVWTKAFPDDTAYTHTEEDARAKGYI